MGLIVATQDEHNPTISKRRTRMQQQANHGQMVNWGLILSLGLNLFVGAFSIGVLYTRVLNLEAVTAEIKAHAQTRDDKLGEVLQKLSAIDERLKNMAERSGKAGK